MNPGTLKIRIEIWDQTSAPAASDSGYLVPETAPVYSGVRARMTYASTREVWQAMAAQTRNIVNFELRQRPGIRVGMRVKCKNQWYEIIALQGRDGLPPQMILKTVLREAK